MSRVVTLYFPLYNLDTGTYQEYPVPSDLENFYVAEVDVDTLDQYQFVIPESGENKGKPKLVPKAPNPDYYSYNFDTDSWELDQTKSNKFIQDTADKLSLSLYNYIENKENILINLQNKYSTIKPFLDKYKEAGFTGRVPIKLNLYLKSHPELTAEKLSNLIDKVTETITTIEDSIEETVYKFSDEVTAIISDESKFTEKLDKINELFIKYKTDVDTKYTLESRTKE